MPNLTAFQQALGLTILIFENVRYFNKFLYPSWLLFDELWAYSASYLEMLGIASYYWKQGTHIFHELMFFSLRKERLKVYKNYTDKQNYII